MEDHASEARSKGYAKVVLEKNERSGHVCHMRVGPVGYWAAVKKIWEETNRPS